MPESSVPNDAAIDLLVSEVAEGLRNARTEEGIAADLVARGLSADDAAAIIARAAQLVSLAREDQHRRGKNLIGMGLLLFVLGIAVTAGTYSSADEGGMYVLAWGPMVFGPVMVFRGWWLLATVR